jgi:hypothetical protein
MKNSNSKETGQNQKPAWNLWKVLDPERWIRPAMVQRHGYFIGYLFLLSLVYIAYIYQCERRIRQISKIEKNNLELRSQYLFLKTELVRLGKLERVVQRASSMGFREMRVPPLALSPSDLTKIPSPGKRSQP